MFAIKNKLVIGTVQFGLKYGINNQAGQVSADQVHQILDHAAVNHVNEIDTAQAYGNSEVVLGEYLKSTKKSFTIQSKFILDDKPENFSTLIEQSLKNLHVAHIDTYYFHRFDEFKHLQNFEPLLKAKQQGKFQKLGVSLYDISELELAASHPLVDVIQLPFNLFDNSAKKIELLKLAKKNNKMTYVRSVFLQGLFFFSVDQLPEKLKSFAKPLEQVRKLADQIGISVQALCLNYALNLPYIDRVVIGVDNYEQFKTNLKIVKELDSATMKTIESELSQITIEQPKLLHPGNWG